MTNGGIKRAGRHTVRVTISGDFGPQFHTLNAACLRCRAIGVRTVAHARHALFDRLGDEEGILLGQLAATPCTP